jgi:signal-transduction protein with cAMP-binding, CBS, and nucleotidyltransferase domain
MNLLSVADIPALQLETTRTVRDAVDAMMARNVGAVAITENGRLTGIFTERDVMTKVVNGRLDPDRTPLHQVMSAPVYHVPATMYVQDALRSMLDRRVRNLVISSDGHAAQGIVALSSLMKFMLEYQEKNLRQMESYLGR